MVKKKAIFIVSILFLAMVTTSVLLVTNRNKTEIRLEDFTNQKVSDLSRLQNEKKQITTWGLKSLGVNQIKRHSNRKEKMEIKIAILDSGINKDHEDLEGQVVKEFNAILNCTL